MSHSSPMKTGLCSVTFRQLGVKEIVALAAKAGVQGIEWGSDVHVPPGQRDIALQTSRMCREAGLSIPSYGSYVRAGVVNEGQDFDLALATAGVLGARNIRVWAGQKGSAQCSPAERRRVGGDLRDYASRAADAGVVLSIERHDNTLTDSINSCLALIDEVDHANCFVCWQPRPADPAEVSVSEIGALKKTLSHLHVLHWLDGNVRRPLQEAAGNWRDIFQALAPPATGFTRFAFLEFTMNDSPQQFLNDSRVLRTLVTACAHQKPDAHTPT